MKNVNSILFIIILSQFAGTSLWFAGNAVINDIILQFGLGEGALSYIVSAVQLGFISGTLTFALFTIADRFSPSRIFFACALAGALSNLYMLMATGLTDIIASRFITGFFLAGIYPVGMKIAFDYHNKGLGKALGYLVGALVLGTAFPHLLNALKAGFNWHYVIVFVSVIAAMGGLLIFLFVPDGPYRARVTKPDFRLAYQLFSNKDFRSAAFGYFGHMWELYTFWAFVPGILGLYLSGHREAAFDTSVWSFLVIASGGIACVLGGYISLKKGNAKTAFTGLFISFVCCLSLYFVLLLPVYFFLPFLLIWGMAVVADSPQFTSLVAQSVDVANRGTALTIVNCIGFAITVVSIHTISFLQQYIAGEYVYFFLAIGPALGLLAFRRHVANR